MKYLISIIFFAFVLVSCGATQSSDVAQLQQKDVRVQLKADVTEVVGASGLDKDYERVDAILADIADQMHQPNILKSDILRGWYLGGREGKKYGTPDTWIFVEKGGESKWMSPNIIDEGADVYDRQLCKATAGRYVASCLDSSDSDCEYVENSNCQCSSESKWKDGQGCIAITERGSYVSINNSELERGWYFGLPNQKKLNTPADWIWIEKGRESVWQRADQF